MRDSGGEYRHLGKKPSTVLYQYSGHKSLSRDNSAGNLIRSGYVSMTGATLLELLVSLLSLSAILLLAGSGLIHVLRADQTSQTEIEQEQEVSRALTFIANDVRESQQVASSAPGGWLTPSGYTPVLYLRKPPDFAEPDVIYYTQTSGADGEGWQGPNVIYRSTVSGSKGSALVDGISSSNPSCFSSVGTPSPSGMTVGFRIFILNSNSVKICLKSENNASEYFEVESQAFLRGAV